MPKPTGEAPPAFQATPPLTAKTLVLGAGRKPIAGAINVDIVSDTNPDVVHDLNVRPWPFPDNSFSEIHANDVIEHLESVIGAMEEIHRVSKAGARVRITVPHFSSPNAFSDPTHRHYFGWLTFRYLTGEHEFSFYTAVRFRVISEQIIFHPTLVNKLVWRLANRWPARYERRWAWMFPAWFLFVELEVVKDPV